MKCVDLDTGLTTRTLALETGHGHQECHEEISDSFRCTEHGITRVSSKNGDRSHVDIRIGNGAGRTRYHMMQMGDDIQETLCL